MRKSLAFAALLLLAVAAGMPLGAAECPTVTLGEPAPPAQSPAQEPEQELAQPDLAEILDPYPSAVEKRPPPPNCGYTACYMTPTGCGCAGFYCNGRFICGYPWI